MTRLDVTVPVPDPHRIGDDPGHWLPSPARPVGHHMWAITLRVGPLHRQVTITVGNIVRDGECMTRHISWEPGQRPGDVLPMEVLLPSFSGELVASESALRIVGTYAPPAALLGKVADVALRTAASHTVHDLLTDIVAAMSSAITQGGGA